MRPLVFCPNGHVFESRAIGVTIAQHATFENVAEPCPICGATADVMDGTFDFLADSIRVLSAPQITIDRLNALQRAIQEVADQPTEQIVETIRREEPELAAVVDSRLPRNTSVATWILGCWH